MDISKLFGMPSSHCKEHEEQPHAYIALVPETWINCLLNGKYIKLHQGWFAKSDISLSNSQNLKAWKKVFIREFFKTDDLVESLLEHPLCYGKGKQTFGEDNYSANAEYWQSLEKEAINKYNNAFRKQMPPHVKKLQEQRKLLKYLLTQLFCANVFNLENEETTIVLQQGCCTNILPVYAIFETAEAFYVIQPYVINSVKTLLAYSPAILEKSNTKLLFIVYQILQAMKYCHENCLAVGNIDLKDMFIDERLWIQLLQPNIHSLYLQPEKSVKNEICDADSQKSKNLHTIWKTVIKTLGSCDLPSITMKWMFGEVSNFEYLLLLNFLAGRRLDDPNHHPVLPWVIDFTSPTSNLRDLSKSKYRLNKGDAQLDQTYSLPTTSLKMSNKTLDLHIRHHVSDVLSDITYYLYKARKTPKSVLCEHVRSIWVPNEYPASIERLQVWTPDECIPEFFIDPEMFKSEHHDLPDLKVPKWAINPENFVQSHMQALESEQVSKNLHHWIDLTFGYKLSGQAAVQAKNVCLQLVDNHTDLYNYGVVQLFSCPHPQKLSDLSSFLASSVTTQESQNFQNDQDLVRKEKRSKPNKGDSDSTLPGNFNPLLLLNSLESFHNFSLQQCKIQPQFPNVEISGDILRDAKRSLINRDMQALGCCIVELIQPAKVRTLSPNAPFQDRFKFCRKICMENWKEIPRLFRMVLNVLFELDTKDLELDADRYGSLFNYKCLSGQKLPPPNVDLLLQANFLILNYPSYFPFLYDTLNKYHQINKEILQLQSKQEISGSDLSEKIYELSKEKITYLSKFVSKFSSRLCGEGIGLIIPYVKELFSEPLCCVQAVWSLFSPVTLVLGPTSTREYLLPYIIKVFNQEDTSPKHIKLYHRSFIVQMKVRLGLETFISCFATLLVEATAGYKDFVSYRDSGVIKGAENLENEAVNVQDEFEVPRDRMNFSLENIQPDETSLLSKSEDVSTGDEKIDTSKTSEGNGEHNSEEISQRESDSLSSFDAVSENMMSRSLGRISVHSMSRFIDTEAEDEETHTSTKGVDKKSLASSYDSVQEAVEATDENVLNSISNMEQKARKHSIAQPEYNLRDVASETIKWLSHILGPVLTAKYFSRNLLRMLSLCYMGAEQQQLLDDDQQPVEKTASVCKKCVVGDVHGREVLHCLSCIAVIYGEHVVLLQYFSHVKQLIHSALQKLTTRAEAGLISCLSLIFHIVPYLSDKTLLDIVEETIFGDILSPVIGIIASIDLSFPNGSQARRILSYKTIDILYIISMRIGFEMTRQHMSDIIQKFFTSFNVVVEKKSISSLKQSESSGSLKKKELDSRSALQRSLSPPHQSSSAEEYSDSFTECEQNKDEILEQLRETFTPEMAHIAYIPFCRLAGGIYMEQKLVNDDLIRNLCAIHDQSLTQKKAPQDSISRSENHSTDTSGYDAEASDEYRDGFGGNLIGNKLTLSESCSPTSNINAQPKHKTTDDSADEELFKSSDMDLNAQRHLRENWLAYWEHEVGLSSDEQQFNFKQIRLMTFGGAGSTGHTSSVRSLYVLDNENSFLSASKDKTVKLWSLRSFGDGTGRAGCQWTYTSHKKSVFTVTMLESLRYAASCDGSVHVWDPFMGACIRNYESAKNSPINVLNAMPAPSSSLLTASESLLRILDVRSPSHVYDLKSSANPIGAIRCATVSENGQYVAVGYTTGAIAISDIRTGHLVESLSKAHAMEILQIRAYNKQTFLTSSLDQSISLWNFDDAKLSHSLKGITEPVHCFDFYKHSLVSATTGNRINVHDSVETKGMFTSIKLKSEVFRGFVTTMAVLPLNKLLLLGSDNGQIRLLA